QRREVLHDAVQFSRAENLCQRGGHLSANARAGRTGWRQKRIWRLDRLGDVFLGSLGWTRVLTLLDAVRRNLADLAQVGTDRPHRARYAGDDVAGRAATLLECLEGEFVLI